jgi:hypothetical protein
MAGKVFINYRRTDDPAFTHAIYLRLEDEFAASDLFMDVEVSSSHNLTGNASASSQIIPPLAHVTR